MSSLRITLLGGVRVARDESAAEMKLTRVVQTLLAYLLLQRQRSHSRETLIGLFWGEHSQDQARSCLSTTLWRLRTILEPAGVVRGAYLTVSPAGEVGFNTESNYWLDVEEFETETTQVLTRPLAAMEAVHAHNLNAALQLYCGELLEGFYEDWALWDRERLRGLYLASLTRLMSYYKEQGAYDDSLRCGQLILQHDPLREDIHRAIIRLYLESGQRALAARQLEVCRDVLAAELSLLPMPETQALHDQIVGAAIAAVGIPCPGDNAHLHQALQQMHLSLQSFDTARTQLQQVIHLCERLIDPCA